jgi:hypothetical protein
MADFTVPLATNLFTAMAPIIAKGPDLSWIGQLPDAYWAGQWRTGRGRRPIGMKSTQRSSLKTIM